MGEGGQTALFLSVKRLWLFLAVDPAGDRLPVGIALARPLPAAGVIGRAAFLRHQRVRQEMAFLGLAWHHQVRDDLEVLADRKSTRLNSSHLGISYAVF